MRGKGCGEIESREHLDSRMLEDMDRYLGMYEMKAVVGPQSSCLIGLL